MKAERGDREQPGDDGDDEESDLGPPAPHEGERGREVEREEDVGEEVAAPGDSREDDDGAGPEEHARRHDDREDAGNGRLGAYDGDRPADDGRLHGEDRDGEERREERLQAEDDAPADRHAEPHRREQRQAASHLAGARTRHGGARAVEILGARQSLLPHKDPALYRKCSRVR